MRLSWWIRIAFAVLVIVIVLIAVRLHVAASQTDGNASSGRHLAEAWCTECHSVERATAGKGMIAPDFTAIAQRPGTTELSLKTFLRSEHKTMPNFIIEPADAADLVAYILTLRRG